MTAIRRTFPLGFPWETIDPFLFCVHHLDRYPAGNAQLAPPREALAGRQIGMDFVLKDGWRMYHGDVVPGFPAHPHRGFETVTIARQGFIDHSDSLGAAARFGQGDVQWLTAGRGIVHAEMFPLLRKDGPNTGELFQIWLNLPAADKMADPHFKMLWSGDVPQLRVRDGQGAETRVTVVAGQLADRKAPAPPPRSWAARADADVAIWTIAMPARGRFTLPPAHEARTRRALYFFAGVDLDVDGQRLASPTGLEVAIGRPVELVAGEAPVELLMLQGRPIGEPVVQHGPFVMNTPQQIQQAYLDFQRTQFGGWPWPARDPNHGATRGRFARHADGTTEERGPGGRG